MVTSLLHFPTTALSFCTLHIPHPPSHHLTLHTYLLTILPSHSPHPHLLLAHLSHSQPTNTCSPIFSPYHSAQPPSHNLTLSVITQTLYNQYQHFHCSLSHSIHPPSHTLTLCTCNIHLLTISFFALIHLLKSSPCHSCANVPESVHLQAPKLSSPPLRFPLSSGLSSMHHLHLLCRTHQAEHHHWFHYSIAQLN